MARKLSPGEAIAAWTLVGVGVWLFTRRSSGAAVAGETPAQNGGSGSHTYLIPLPGVVQQPFPADAARWTFTQRADIERVGRAQLDLLGFQDPNTASALNSFLRYYHYVVPAGLTVGQETAWIYGKLDERARLRIGANAS